MGTRYELECIGISKILGKMLGKYLTSNPDEIQVFARLLKSSCSTIKDTSKDSKKGKLNEKEYLELIGMDKALFKVVETAVDTFEARTELLDELEEVKNELEKMRKGIEELDKDTLRYIG